MAKVITFGEVMLRLNPPRCLRFTQANSFEASYAGSEANVAVALAQYGEESAFVSKVPSHEIGQSAVNELRRYGVDTSRILRGGPRLGVYYVEKGASQRGGKVIYDRANSSIALAKADEYDWESILEGADWFHFSGITPALGDDAALACKMAAKTAKRMGLTVSLDLNYRSALWEPDVAGCMLVWMLPYVDVCMMAQDEARIFYIKSEEGLAWREAAVDVARKVQKRYRIKNVGVALLNEMSASDTLFSGVLCTEDQTFFAPDYPVRVVDRVGCGDSFSAGLIHAMVNGWDSQKAVDFATAAGCLKQTVEYDFSHSSEAETLLLVNGAGSGGVRR